MQITDTFLSIPLVGKEKAVSTAGHLSYLQTWETSQPVLKLYLSVKYLSIDFACVQDPQWWRQRSHASATENHVIKGHANIYINGDSSINHLTSVVRYIII